MSNSSPVEGLEVSLRTYSDVSKKISIYVFGDAYTGSPYLYFVCLCVMWGVMFTLANPFVPSIVLQRSLRFDVHVHVHAAFHHGPSVRCHTLFAAIIDRLIFLRELFQVPIGVHVHINAAFHHGSPVCAHLVAATPYDRLPDGPFFIRLAFVGGRFARPGSATENRQQRDQNADLAHANLCSRSPTTRMRINITVGTNGSGNSMSNTAATTGNTIIQICQAPWVCTRV